MKSGKGKKTPVAQDSPPPPPTTAMNNDSTLLLNVEELIGVSFGAHTLNSVNFKMLQTVLHILARQMRLLEQHVEIKFTEGNYEAVAMQEERQIGEENLQADEPAKGAKEKVGGGKDTDKGRKEKGKESSKDKGKDTLKDKGKDTTEEEVEKQKEQEIQSEKIKTKQKGKNKDINAKPSIAVTEGRGALLVEVGTPGAAARSRPRVGSIEVVTRSQFNLLEDAVNALSRVTKPVPQPTMPSDKQLKADLAKGTASLTDTMDAMQVNARIQAAEQAISKMAGLLTALALTGAVPRDMAKEIQGMLGEVRELGLPLEMEETDILSKIPFESVASDTSIVSEEIKPLPPPLVTHSDLDNAIKELQRDVVKNMIEITDKAAMSADHAKHYARSLDEKLNVALNINNRIDVLYALTTDYAEQTKGFDSGLTTQLQSFQEQMQQMKTELRESLGQLDLSNNAESLAITELKEGYEKLVTQLDETFHEHSVLDFTQKQLAEELKRLTEWVEMLREQKADCDEVADGLRDKADIVRLKGLLTEVAFEEARAELERRLELCYEKFHKQDEVWLGALKDISRIASNKAELMQLLTLKEQIKENLKKMTNMLKDLEIMLGEPVTALLTRRLASGARCGACLVPALMQLEALTLHNMPKAEEPCVRQLTPLAPPDVRQHICKRWVGGSHTLLTEHVTRATRDPTHDAVTVPTKRYVDYGTDGRLYMMEVPLQPCEECRPSPVDDASADEAGVIPLSEVGGGDQGVVQDEAEGNKEEKIP